MKAIADQLVGAGMSAEAASSRAALFARVETALAVRGASPAHGFHVPGRIEVLGKHTDYAGGRSLLAAVERGFCVVSAPRHDTSVRLIDVGRGDEATLYFDPLAAELPAPHWALYPKAVVQRLVRDFGPDLRGAEVAFVSDLPPASGLSSSSALIVATFEALRLANDLDARAEFREALPTVLDVAAYLGSVESGRPFRRFGGAEGVGTAGGSQDHTAILASEPGRICQFGYAPPRLEASAALPKDLVFLVAVSGVAAKKAAGAREDYNRAAALVAALLEIWRTRTGRSDPTLFEAMASHPEARPRLREAVLSSSPGRFPSADLEARLDQFVEETFVLIPAALGALISGDLPAFGRAVDRSQQGAERGLRNQIPETVDLAHLARSVGAHAASAFGAGFGGSVWALVSKGESGRFREEWERLYRERHPHQGASFFPTEAGPALCRLIRT